MEEPFRADIPPGLTLIETLGWHPGQGARHGARHLARMARSAARLGFDFDPDAARAALICDGPASLRLRLTSDAAGRIARTLSPLPPTPARWTVALHPDRLQPDDPWLGIKSTNRALYDRARAALPAGLDEYLFLNTAGELCEGTITTLFAQTADGRHLTPPLSSGVLPGILRQMLLEQGPWQEGVLRPADLASARAVWMGNSLRGLIPVRLAGNAAPLA